MRTAVRRREILVRDRRGLTVVEVLVVTGIVVILISLLLPAVTAARSAARKLRCSSNLRQLTIALQRYADAHGVYPPTSVTWYTLIRPGLSGETFPRGFSQFAHLLPYLGDERLYNAINFELWPFGFVNGAVVDTYAWRANQTVAKTRVSVFLCPADPQTALSGVCSYRGCTGILDHWATRRGWPDSGRGIFRHPVIRPAYVEDGLGHTVAFGERLVGTADFAAPVDRARDVVTFVVAPIPNRTDQYVSICYRLSSGPLPSRFVHAGRFWIVSGPLFTLYNHVLPPNSPVTDCVLENLWGAMTARSYHEGGVNVAFADGHVKFVSNSVDLAVWRAIATRDGGEPVDGF